LHDPRILGLLLIVEEPVIFRVAHGILHLLSAPTIKQLRNTVYCSRAAGILDRDFFWALQARLKAQRNNRTATRQIRVLAVCAIFNTTLAEDSQARGKWHTKHGGIYYAIGIGGAVLGRGADVLLIDDPYSPNGRCSTRERAQEHDAETPAQQQPKPGGTSRSRAC
jgi:hypothetical protein